MSDASPGCDDEYRKASEIEGMASEAFLNVLQSKRDNPAKGTVLGDFIDISQSFTLYFHGIGAIDDLMLEYANEAFSAYKQHVKNVMNGTEAPQFADLSDNKMAAPDIPPPAPIVPPVFPPGPLEITVGASAATNEKAKLLNYKRQLLQGMPQSMTQQFNNILAALFTFSTYKNFAWLLKLAKAIIKFTGVGVVTSMALVGYSSMITRVSELKALERGGYPTLLPGAPTDQFFDTWVRGDDELLAEYAREEALRWKRVGNARGTRAHAYLSTLFFEYKQADGMTPMKFATFPTDDVQAARKFWSNILGDWIYVYGYAKVALYFAVFAFAIHAVLSGLNYKVYEVPKMLERWAEANDADEAETWANELAVILGKLKQVREQSDPHLDVVPTNWSNWERNLNNAKQAWIDAFDYAPPKTDKIDASIQSFHELQDRLFAKLKAMLDDDGDPFLQWLRTYKAAIDRKRRDIAEIGPKTTAQVGAFSGQREKIRQGGQTPKEEYQTLTRIVYIAYRMIRVYDGDNGVEGFGESVPRSQTPPPARPQGGRAARSPARRRGIRASTVDDIIDQFLEARMGK